MNAGRGKKTGTKERPQILTQASAVMHSLRGATKDEIAMSDGGEDQGVCGGHWRW